MSVGYKHYILNRYSYYAGGMCILVFSNAVESYSEEKLKYTTGTIAIPLSFPPLSFYLSLSLSLPRLPQFNSNHHHWHGKYKT